MLIPLRTDRHLRRRPVITEGLLLVNLLVYLTGLAGAYANWFDIRAFIDAGSFKPHDFRAWQLITYQFLHDPTSIWHLAFNMLFLWVFGTAVEDRIGRIGFLGFYLIGGAVAGLAHAQVTSAPVIGASGSIAAVTGGFLALFPRSTIRVLFIFFIIGIYHIPSLWFIGFYFVVDVLRQTGELLGGGQDRVAYMAHIAGYIYGFVLAFTLLGLRIIKREDMDIFYMFSQSRRRAAFRELNRSTHGAAWEAPAAPSANQYEQQQSITERPLTETERQVAAKRTRINELVAQHKLAEAAAMYRDLMRIDARAAFSESRQLDLANQLYAEGHHADAARAYELFIESYPGSGSIHEVRLALGTLYARRLGKPDRARELLDQAKARLADQRQIALAETLLGELGTS